MDVQRSVTVLGSTGSVGRNTLDLIARAPERFRLEALTGNRNAKLLAEQARIFKPAQVVIGDESLYQDLKEELTGTEIDVAAGRQALVEAAMRPSDLVLASIVGMAGLEPTMAAAERGTIVGLANKEGLVCAGTMLMEAVQQNGGALIPVDSEHNAIFQVFNFRQADSVERLILTASGGPFRESPINEMSRATPQQAVAHPNWDMGAKISVDSATMMNKGLELIEAYFLFPVREDQIDILVHPQSVVHSMVEYVDGSVLAQLGSPDMRTPISYALSWPTRMATPSPRLQLDKIANLTFEAPDIKRFPALQLAREALQAGGTAPAILNAANEVAVRYFLDESIGFLDICGIVADVLAEMPPVALDTMDAVYEIDTEARALAEKLAKRLASAK
ncbi:MAG: 1-deoxy-D-xylulose-5-phosphate reductoisomerase [Rhodospirillaceae bacterium]|nr:1-deoxy-D-xylulose-5-phosphate reductoisomerase [Rhodospirillaceae bacterium]MBT3885373.1 1-deoxy-D-xylulose-5-phosphate reductoisomerase [Rhodospirillaceae bacterium]MBT4118782.1 1-deoxy-D-xylulose-5-phosphate reductoisomerase [Rhodospirillaceae bacterium]MBT4671494.1 1-deoxy-D-xylulose-5-phosphate reductoisomerase [Rhodospirillaceae bacterium]MBT4719879.1 1-deoxy-D-xylulose-5-phosphate reductoisomerase [Rhodospirillaceae bacterium]